MSKTAIGLVNFALSQVGIPTVYAAKGQVITQELINQWAKQYPNIYTSSYKQKAEEYIGTQAHDCSGLISRYTGIVRNSKEYKNTATKVLPITQFNNDFLGWAVWKEGHIGVCVGNGYVVEARSVYTGTIKTSVATNNWTHILQLKDINYSSEGAVKSFKFTIRDYQKWLNDNYTSVIKNNCGALLVEDNLYGNKTRNASVCVWKYEMNKLKVGYTFDLKNTNFGSNCRKYGNNAIVKRGKKGAFVYLAEGILRAKSFYVSSLDGIAGSALDSAIREFQKSRNLTVDGECGANTWNQLFNS